MAPAPRPPRTPYWTLPALLVLISLPLSWSMIALIGAAGFRLTLAARRGGAARRAAARAAVGSGPMVALGTDERGRPVALEERQLAAHGLILGASGAGKSTTLLAIVEAQIAAGRPVVTIDLKGSPAFTRALEAATERAGRPFRLWTPDGPGLWNPLSYGNATELKDKLIATERFSEPHYQRAAERYVQTALTVLRASGHEPHLAGIVALMEPRRLAAAVRGLDAPLAERVQDYLAVLGADQLSAVRGLETRLALLSEGSAGPFLMPGPPLGSRPAADGHAAPGSAPGVDLRRALEGSEVVHFSLNSSRYGKLAAQLGTLAVQDLISATGNRLEHGSAAGQATVAVDEFSALGSDQILQLLARGREAGVSVLLATQELSDLERAARGFRDQVLGLTALKIAHRQDVPGSARTIAEMAGTERVWEETQTLGAPLGAGPRTRGTRREVEAFVIHPSEIKRLETGQAVLLTKTPTTRVTRVRVSPRSPTAPPPTGRRSNRPGSPTARGRDQPEPGVTR